jgi:phospholipase C
MILATRWRKKGSMRKCKLLTMLLVLTAPCFAQQTIKHLIFIIKENRSFDSYFNNFPGTGSNLTSYPCKNGSQSGLGGCNCVGNGCTGTVAVQAGNPNTPDNDCGHLHDNYILDYDSGLMDRFNQGGVSCGSCVISGEACSYNTDCASGDSCHWSWNTQYNSTTIPRYWQLASTYGLGSIFSSAMGPTFVSHQYVFSATSSETGDNPSGLAAGGPPPNGQAGANWTLDTYHLGTCGVGSTTNKNGLCNTDIDCGGGAGSCWINRSIGKCCQQGVACDFAAAGNSCTRNDDCASAQLGTISISNGSTAVVGAGTNFNASWAGTILYVANGSSATVASVTDATHLTLAGTYTGTTNSSAGFSMGLQFCAGGNIYGNVGDVDLYYAVDLAGSAGASGTNTGNQMWPGVCQAHRTIACVRVCGENCSSPTSSNVIDDPACQKLGDTCDVQEFTGQPGIMQGSRGSVGVNVTTLADLLDSASVSWGYYANSDDLLRMPVSYYPHLWYGADANKVYSDSQFAIDAGNCISDTSCPLPTVTWLQGGNIGTSATNEHPPNLVSVGEAWSMQQVNAVMYNPYLWNNTAIFILWDDFGGFYDHVAPTVDGQMWRNGFRVPVICVSKYCKSGFNSSPFVFESMGRAVENFFLGGVHLPGSLYDAQATDLGTGCVAGAGCTGHTSNNGMIDLTLSDPVITIATTTTLISSLNPSNFGQSVTLTATVTAQRNGTPAGTVNFFDGTSNIGNSTLNAGGVATLVTASLAAGTHSLTASYNGSAIFSPSTSSPLAQSVNQTTSTTNLSANINPSVYGQAITLTATISPRYGGSATGTVNFYDGSTLLGAVNVSSDAAILSGLLLPASSHTLTAAYNGDNNVLGSTSAPLTERVVVATSTTSLTSSANPIAPNQSVTYTARVTSQYGAATSGTVTFKDGSVSTQVPLTKGSAVLTTRYATIGTHSLTATYSGDTNNTGSTSNTWTEYVENLPVASKTVVVTSGSPSTVGQPVTFTATVTSTYGQIPNGETVTFYDGVTKMGTGTTSNGIAAFTTSSLSVKTHNIIGTYAGDPSFKASSGSVKQIVNPYTTTTSLTASPNPSAYGQTVLLAATVTSSGGVVPTGKITFYNGVTSLGTVTLTAGTATLSTAKLGLGSNSITAAYGGDSLNGKSTSSVLKEIVNAATITLALSSSPNPSNSGQSVKFTATLMSNGSLPNGQTVTFTFNTTTLGTGTIVGGKATFSTTTLPSGSDKITASYAGDADYSAASGTVTQTVN